jgi:hypothetical protein
VELHSYNHDFAKLQHLTIIFLTKPALAHSVRHFTLRDPYKYCESQSNRDETETLVIEGVVKEAIAASSHSADEFKEWILDVQDNYPDPFLAILLPTMVRLKKLDLMLQRDCTRPVMNF